MPYFLTIYYMDVFRNFTSRGSIIYFTILTLVFIIVLFTGNFFIFQVTSADDRYAKYTYAGILLFFYVIFLGLYYLKWTIEGIFLMLLMFSVLFSLFAFMVIYFAPIICEEGEEIKKDSQWQQYLIVFLGIVVVILALYGRLDYTNWTMYDTVRFVIILISIRLMYYLSLNYGHPLLKTSTDILLLYVLYEQGRRMYYVYKA